MSGRNSITALHTCTQRIRITRDHIGLSAAELRARVEAEHPLVEHPLVKRGPVTGRRHVYGVPEYPDRVTGFGAGANTTYHASTAVERGQVRTVHRISIAAPDS
ncbi:hypothetical protein [Streptomyces roseochromogenus]|uniref:Uncharacterized protein n=1 Tax=Streptomyces roseochromogenus subsp. oscitans DS 12.976 TaxID=1352936 RepID=V6KU56_STRRC|nr:hypothetical protein [Streptomyces roseochromogenus]EST35690.1 hypothetical protein M878_04770 [Streptomyces roseochromogenus subsp. oscitans DS 12.976]